MAENDDIKKAELRGYSRGYNAGRLRKEKNIRTERIQAERQAFMDRAFLAALPACINAQGWKAGDKPITSFEDRTKLAWDFAERALKTRRYA